MKHPVNVEKGSQHSVPFDLLVSPFLRFARMEAAGGIVLLAGTVAALVWANSPWQSAYHDLWDTHITVGFGKFVLSEKRYEWINDGLMSIFFFMVGLEIKRELLVGELSSIRHAAFPFIAAVGGTVVPALLYLSVAGGPATGRGWAIPMATDIAFTLGVLALLGSRIPDSLKVFVTALAIVDDIIAILVIAIFYTAHIDVFSLAIAGAGLAVSCIANMLGIRKPIVYAAIGIVVWFAVLKSGVHATVAGVLLALTVPAQTYMERDRFLARTRALLDRFEKAEPNSFEAHTAIHSMEKQLELIESPLQRIEHSVQPWVGFAVMPLFALANAGVHIGSNLFQSLAAPVPLGILIGLFVGKPLGIWLFAWIAAAMGLASPPANLSWPKIFGASWLCGIGFTMSLFISGLAFEKEELLNISKLGILVGSLAAGICGAIYLVTVLKKGQGTESPAA